MMEGTMLAAATLDHRDLVSRDSTPLESLDRSPFGDAHGVQALSGAWEFVHRE
jgi:hypothetical protein